MYDSQLNNRLRLIQMVADGDLKIVEITVNGLRFEYTNEGPKRFDVDDGRDRGERTVGMLLLIALFMLVSWTIELIFVLGRG